MKLLKENWMFVAAIMALAIGFLLTAHCAQRRHLEDLRTEIAQTRVAIDTDSARAASVPQLVAQVDHLKNQFQDFDHRLPRQQELGEFLRDISSLARSGAFSGQAIEPGSPAHGSLYDCLPIIMHFNCRFADLAAFLEGLGGMKRLSRVEKLDVQPDSSGSGLLRVETQINIYFTES